MEAGHGQDRENLPASDLPSGAPSGGPPSGPSSGRSRRRGLLVGGVIALGLLLLTVGTIVLVLLTGPGDRDGRGSAAGPQNFEERYVSGEGPDRIAVLPIAGQISSAQDSSIGSQTATPQTFRDQLTQAAEDDRVKAVVVEVNSPGGGVVASQQMHKSIQEFKEETSKPVIVSMSETAASGGYYLATAADRIVANETTLTGSLGVIFSYLNLTEAAEEYGVEQEVIKSGPYKDIGSPTREPTEEELEILQNLVNESYDQFVGVIVEGRNLQEDEVRAIADGRVYSGLQAESLGLVDELGDLDRAAEIAGSLAGAGRTTVVRYERAPGFVELLSNRLEPSEPQALEALESAGINLTPELQYLYRP